MKGFDKLHIKSAVKSRNKFNLDFSHITTMDFGQLVPLACLETLPGDSFHINPEYFSRLAPMVKPTYGKFTFNTVTGFVPAFQIADDAAPFYDGLNSWEGTTPRLRYITVASLCKFITDRVTDQHSLLVGEYDDNKGHICDVGGNVIYTYDLSWADTSGNMHYGRFTGAVKYFYKVLVALGYKFPSLVDFETGNWTSGFGAVKLNAMPLLAFFKLYNDWMSQSTRYNTSALTSFLRCVKHNITVTGYYPSTRLIDDAGLATLFQYLQICYETDYFLSAWQNPSNPIGVPQSISTVSSPASNGANNVTVTSSIYNTSIPGNMSTISQRALEFLKSFDDWVRRNNYAGSRAVQQIYARFGVKSEDFRSNYAHLISTSKVPLSVGDVTATAGTDTTISGNTESIALGDYAGKGIVHDKNSFDFRAEDHGYLFVFGYFTVAPMNAYGFNKQVLKTEPFDFYTPEFDGLGADAISVTEFFTNPIAPSNDSSLDTNVYGYTERYNEYRFGRDVISGEMLDYHPDGDMNCWHSGRLMNDIRANGNLRAQAMAVVEMPNYDSDFNRIFSVPNKDFDHFYLTAQFNVTAERNILNLNQVPGLGVGDTVVARNGNEVN